MGHWPFQGPFWAFYNLSQKSGQIQPGPFMAQSLILLNQNLRPIPTPRYIPFIVELI
jgi:hypothetical protein